jgi:P27 family predicted phage terminase small subunit
MAGRKPKPTAMKLVKGTLRSSRTNPDEPKLQCCLPPCPPHLTDLAKDEYNRLGRKLVKAGIMTALDEIALAALCQSWAQYIEATEDIEKNGLSTPGATGADKLNPSVTAANVFLTTVRSLLAEFGMTPASRSRIAAAPAENLEGEEWARFIK